MRTRGGTAVVAGVAGVLGALVLAGCSTTVGPPDGSGSGSTAAPASLVRDPASLVNPMAGTGTGPVQSGAVGEFPGADVPFGMVQWSPDTTPNTAGSGGGYSYADSQISGFSLTHLSGTGCAAYGDIPILPTVGSIGSDPEQAVDTFSHAHETAAPGRYQSDAWPSADHHRPHRHHPDRHIPVHLSRHHQANLLFKVAGSANPVTASSFGSPGTTPSAARSPAGNSAVPAPTTRCTSPPVQSTFLSFGGWNGTKVTPGSSSCAGSACGAFVYLRHHIRPHRADEGGHLVRQRAQRAAEPARRGPGLVARKIEARPPTVERHARAHPRRRRNANGAAHVLHRALPLTPASERGQRR